MKLISVLSFKGGVGKTTVTWLLARYLVEMRRKTVLVVDTDPQMSLITAVELLETVGRWDLRFDDWYKQAKTKQSTLYHLLLQYIKSSTISTPESPLYVHRPNLYLLPSDEELYWYNLETPPTSELRKFTASLLEFIERQGDLPRFDYCFADCPPAFNSLSLSVVSHSDLVLIPVNPDIFASKAVTIMLSGLKKRVEPLPPFLVFMNRARSRIDKVSGGPMLTRESRKFLIEEVAPAVEREKESGVPIELLEDVFIPERKGIKDAIAGQRRIPPDLENYFAELWDRIETHYFPQEIAPAAEEAAKDVLETGLSEIIGKK